MRQIVEKIKQQVKDSVSLKVFLMLALLTCAVSSPWPWTSAGQERFQRGDVFVSLGDGRVLRFSQTTGALLQTLDTATGSFVTGAAFDKNANLYVTAFASRTVVRFDVTGNRLGTFGSGYNGRPESVLFDADGNAYVGTVDGDNDVLKFDATGNLLDRYDVAAERRGSDWIELAADKCTLYYTSEGSQIKRFNICTKTQLPDFVGNLPHSAAYALRLLPTGGLIVADTNEVLRLDDAGNIVRRYDAPGEDSWFAMNLDPDGRSFWSGGISTGNVYKFDIESGNQLARIPSGSGAIYGVAVLGEITVILPPSPSPSVSPSPTPTGSADLSLAKTAAPDVANDGTLINYVVRITNNGPSPATNVRLSDTLPNNTTFVSCSTSNGGSCTGDGQNRGAVFALLGVGETVSVSYTVRVSCAGIESAVLTNQAQVTATNFDPNLENNVSRANVTVAPPDLRVSYASGDSASDFGVVQATRGAPANPPSQSFSIANVGCLPQSVRLGVRRVGADTQNGKITQTDDSSTFLIRLVNADGTLSPVTGPLAVAGGTRRDFRIFFAPRIPMAAGKITGLSANQAIPDVINSVLEIGAINGDNVSLLSNRPLVGRVTPEVKLINPTAPSLSPLVVLARNNDEFAVEFSVHDADMDVFCAVYQFLNEANLPVGEAPTFYIDQDIANANMVRGQSFTVVKRFSGANSRPQVRKVKVAVHDRVGNITEVSGNLGSQAGRVVNVSAASFAVVASLAPESVVAAFGERLATESRAATSAPLPTELAGTRVVIIDSRYVERAAPLFFVAPGQINYQIPAGTAAGPALVTVMAGDGAVSVGNLTIDEVAPALFTAASTGQGLAAGIALRVKADGSQVYEPLARYDAGTQRFVPVAIDLSNDKEQVYLVLFGTGIRYRRSPQPVRASVGGVDVPVLYAGAQGGLVGVDQVNLLLPRSLAGRGEVEIRVIVDGKSANPVRAQMR